MKKNFWFSLVLLSVLFAGCAPQIAFPTLKAPDKPKTIYRYRETITPLFLTGTNNKTYVANQKEVVADLDSTPRKVGVWESIVSFFGGLSFWILVLLIIAFILAPAGTIMFLFSQVQRFKGAFTETVAAIKDSNAKNENEKLKEELRIKQSTKTKKMVGEIKAKL